MKLQSRDACEDYSSLTCEGTMASWRGFDDESLEVVMQSRAQLRGAKGRSSFIQQAQLPQFCCPCCQPVQHLQQKVGMRSCRRSRIC